MDEYVAELKRAEAEGFTFRLDMNATETVAFIGNLQLALRHPGKRRADCQALSKNCRRDDRDYRDSLSDFGGRYQSRR